MRTLLAQLADAGFPVSSIDELRESHTKYVAAVPILVDALRTAEDLRERQSLVRALTVPWAKKLALMPLIEQFRAIPFQGGPQEESLRWAVGNALEVLWDDARFDDLLLLAADRRYGKAREMVVLGLGRSRRPEAGDALIELLEDPVVNGHAVKALAKLKLIRSRPGLERMTSDPRAWVRNAAAGAIRKLEALS